MTFYKKRTQAVIWDDIYNALQQCMFDKVEFAGFHSRQWLGFDDFDGEQNLKTKLVKCSSRMLPPGMSRMPEKMLRRYHTSLAISDPMLKAAHDIDAGEMVMSRQFEAMEGYQPVQAFFTKWGAASRVIISLPSPSENWFPAIVAYSSLSHVESEYMLAMEAVPLMDKLIRLNHEMMQQYADQFNPFLSNKAFSDNALRIIKLISVGYSNQQAAEQVDMTEDGIKYHLKRMRGLLGARNVTHLVALSKDIQLI